MEQLQWDIEELQEKIFQLCRDRILKGIGQDGNISCKTYIGT